MSQTREQDDKYNLTEVLANPAAVDYARQIVKRQEDLITKALDIHAEEGWTIESIKDRVCAIEFGDDKSLTHYTLDGKLILVMQKPEFVGETTACEIHYKIMEKGDAS